MKFIISQKNNGFKVTVKKIRLKEKRNKYMINQIMMIQKYINLIKKKHLKRNLKKQKKTNRYIKKDQDKKMRNNNSHGKNLKKIE